MSCGYIGYFIRSMIKDHIPFEKEVSTNGKLKGIYYPNKKTFQNQYHQYLMHQEPINGSCYVTFDVMGDFADTMMLGLHGTENEFGFRGIDNDDVVIDGWYYVERMIKNHYKKELETN